MFTLRKLLIVATGAAAFAGLQSSNALACDNDRFPCPVITEAAPLESSDAGATSAPTAQPRKKPDRSTKPAAAQNAAPRPTSATQARKQADRAARGGEKAQDKVARAAPGGATALKTDKPEVVPEAVIAPAAQSPSVTENAREAPLAGTPSNNSNTGVIATAGTDWAALPNAEGGSPPEPKIADATQGASQNPVQVVQTNEVNEIDQAASTIPPASTWITYILLIFGAVLAAGAAIWFFRRPIPMYPRRVADQ